MVVPQPLRNLQDTLLSSSGGAETLSVVIGTSSFKVTFQPHLQMVSHISTNYAFGDKLVRNEIGQLHQLEIKKPKK